MVDVRCAMCDVRCAMCRPPVSDQLAARFALPPPVTKPNTLPPLNPNDPAAVPPPSAVDHKSAAPQVAAAPAPHLKPSAAQKTAAKPKAGGAAGSGGAGAGGGAGSGSGEGKTSPAKSPPKQAAKTAKKSPAAGGGGGGAAAGAASPNSFPVNNVKYDDADRAHEPSQSRTSQPSVVSSSVHNPPPRSCQFCGAEDPTFTEEKLDLHFWQDCPMLASCKHCEQVIEIATLNEHLLKECEAANVQACTRCAEPVPAASYADHIKRATCLRMPHSAPFRPSALLPIASGLLLTAHVCDVYWCSESR